MKKLLIKFPTRARAEKFLAVLEYYFEMITNNNTRFLITLDNDDEQMLDPAVQAKLDTFPFVTYIFGKPEGKIGAVNRDLKDHYKKFDVILLASDDMIPMEVGFDDIILSDMNKYFPDGDGVLHYNDGVQGNKLNTLVVVDKKYYERFYYLYHPDYKSLWSDNEFMLVSQKLKRVQYIDRVIIQHQHPDVDARIETDDLYKLNNKFWDADESTFKRRKAAGFPV